MFNFTWLVYDAEYSYIWLDTIASIERFIRFWQLAYSYPGILRHRCVKGLRNKILANDGH